MSKNYSLEDDSVKVEILRMKNEGLSGKQISESIGISQSTLSRFLNRITHQDWWSKNQKPFAKGQLSDHHKNLTRLKGSCFIITAAQNNTYVNSNMLKTIQQIVKHRNAKLVVGTFAYNKTGFQNLQKGNEGCWYDPKIADFIIDEPCELAEGLIWCGELNILPTAVNPLSGFHSYTKSASGIMPHAKVQLESLPRHKQAEPRFLYTTGAITQQNYIQKKSGQKAAFHHVYGALIVEVDSDGDWFVRQLIADKQGNIQDLDCLYTPDEILENTRVEAINWGDLHSEKKDEQVYNTQFVGPKSILNTLKPRYQFIHDVLDFEARNHHSIKDPYFQYKMFLTGKDSVRDNIIDVTKTLKLLNRDYCHTVVVESNHDLALKKWLTNSDYRTDPKNAIFFLECQLKIYQEMAKNQEREFSIFEHCVKSHAPELSDLTFLRTDESFMICNDEGEGIECGSHGDLGINGSRGSINAFQKAGTRYNIGHSHSANIKDGVCQSGTSGKMDKGYNRGITSWSHSLITTYPNGKRTIITIKNGKYRGN